VYSRQGHRDVTAFGETVSACTGSDESPENPIPSGPGCGPCTPVAQVGPAGGTAPLLRAAGPARTSGPTATETAADALAATGVDPRTVPWGLALVLAGAILVALSRRRVSDRPAPASGTEGLRG
jgi:hypothetical protein